MSKETRDATAEGRPSYKDTLNLLQTGFGMRANAVRRAPELQAFWAEQGVDQKLGLETTDRRSRSTMDRLTPTAPCTWATH